MDQSLGSLQTQSTVVVRGPGVSVFGLPINDMRKLLKKQVFLHKNAKCGQDLSVKCRYRVDTLDVIGGRGGCMISLKVFHQNL